MDCYFIHRCYFLSFVFLLALTSAYDPLDPYQNITIRWDVLNWRPDGYAAAVTIFNYQLYRHIQQPGWSLGWTWAKNELIWDMQGAEAVEQGDCSKYKGESIPHCCSKDPTVVDLMPGVSYNRQTANCCRGGVLSSWAQDPAKAVSSFQLGVGSAGTTKETVRLPKNFQWKAQAGYTCGPAHIAKPTKFPTPNGRRVTQALMSWSVTCTYSQFKASQSPTCCVSLSAFYSDTIAACPECTCGCPNNISCVQPNSPIQDNMPPLVQCTRHMCPVRVHWHIKLNYRDYWRVKITLTNFHYNMNYTDWNLVAQHPNFDNLTSVFSFNYKSLPSYSLLNDTALLWGEKNINDMLMQDGKFGNVQSELLFGKDKSTFDFRNGWAFPRVIYFNGDNCVMPPSDAYPNLPNSSPASRIPLLGILLTFLYVTFLCM